jgi:TRAP-type C4-dicarboxylate transport system permease small subunit
MSENASRDGDMGAGRVAEPVGAPLPAKEPEREPRAGAPWAMPLKRFEDAWTRLEAKLCAGVLVGEVLALCAWIVLKGLATPTSTGSKAGLVFRAVLGAVALGTAAHFATRKRGVNLHRASTTLAAIAGLFLAKAWIGVGTVYFSNLLNWLQDASSLTLIGGLRGLGTRLTVWLAMIGASLAAASGKHINIDVVMRFLKPQARVPAAVAAWIATAMVCVTAAWGFTDHISIESYDAPRAASAGQKLSLISHKAVEGFFLLRKQIALDLSTLPVVLGGKRYDTWLTNGEWTRRIQDAGWESHFTPEQVAALRPPPEVAAETRVPLVVAPGETVRGVLVHLLNLVFPIGFLFIAARFLLRALLAVAGHVRVDPDAVHGEIDEAERDDAPEAGPVEKGDA